METGEAIVGPVIRGPVMVLIASPSYHVKIHNKKSLHLCVSRNETVSRARV